MKTALITGSSRGIGRAIAIALAKDGYKILVHAASNIQKAEETASIIRSGGGEAEILMTDLSDLEQTRQLCGKLPNVDVLVLNASLQFRTPWQQITTEECYNQLNCNFVSGLLLIQAVTEYMQKRKWGRIITIGSVQEAKPHPDMLIYAASKAAQTNMMRSLSLQLAKDGITVNNVAPGVINTDRNVEALSDPVYAQLVMDTIPAGFYGEPEDVASIVALLCSEEGRYITGQSLYVDGGKGVM